MYFVFFLRSKANGLTALPIVSCRRCPWTSIKPGTQTNRGRINFPFPIYTSDCLYRQTPVYLYYYYYYNSVIMEFVSAVYYLECEEKCYDEYYNYFPDFG